MIAIILTDIIILTYSFLLYNITQKKLFLLLLCNKLLVTFAKISITKHNRVISHINTIL